MVLPPGPAGLKFWQPQGITQGPFTGTLAANDGSYSLTGSDINLGPGYQLTGFDAAFVIAISTLPAGAGSYTLTGSAAGSGVSKNANGRGRQLCPHRRSGWPGARLSTHRL